MKDDERKELELSLDDDSDMRNIARALSSEVRLAILKALLTGSKSIKDLSEILQIPMSTVSTSVSILEEAGLITTEYKPQERGMLKLCFRHISQVSFRLDGTKPIETSEKSQVLTMSMSVGCYSDARDITPTCGMCSEYSMIGGQDNPLSFFRPERFTAQRIWFHSGFLEYRFSFEYMDKITVKWLELSCEVCSEVAMYRDPWKSDIDVFVNERKLGTFESPCDCGGVRGTLTPLWTSVLSTQYGFLKTWRLDESGTYLDGMKTGDLMISDVPFSHLPYISVRIGVSEDAVHVGGINILGEKYGNYPQALVLKLGYQMNK